MFERELEILHHKIRNSNSVLITGSSKEDADSISSEIALKIIIDEEFKDKRVEIVNESECPEKFRFLLKDIEIFKYSDRSSHSYDVGIVVDCGSERSGLVSKIFNRCSYRVKIDHHPFGNEGKYHLEISSTDVGSTTEIVYHFLESKKWKAKLTQRTAELIYSGLISDTGSFQYDLTRPSSLRIAAKLIETGFNFTKTAELINLSRSYEMKKLLGLVLCNLKINTHKNIVWSFVTRKMMEESGATNSDLSDVMDELCFIKDVEISILFIEERDGTKVSIRSKGGINVGAFCKSITSTGGGHPRAAGCKLNMDMEKAINLIIDKLESILLSNFSDP